MALPQLLCTFFWNGPLNKFARSCGSISSQQIHITRAQAGPVSAANETLRTKAFPTANTHDDQEVLRASADDAARLARLRPRTGPMDARRPVSGPCTINAPMAARDIQNLGTPSIARSESFADRRTT
jgi:hypothetical protein